MYVYIYTAFMMLKEAMIQVPMLRYPEPTRRYIVYTDASDNTCGAQLSQEHDGAEFPIAFLSHTFTETRGNGVPQNRKLMECNMPLPNGITTFKELTS